MPRPPEAGGATKCLTPPPTRRPPHPSGTQSGRGTPTLVPAYPSSSSRPVPSKLERWDPKGRAGCPQTQAGAVCCPPTLLPVPYFLETHPGVPHCRGCPLCTLTP